MVQVVFVQNKVPALTGVVSSVSTKYTMFLPDGTPTRCVATMKLKAASKVSTKKQEPCP
jgi:hypothetical protein